MPTISTLTVEVDTKTDKMKAGLRSAGIALAGLGVAAVATFKAFEESEQVAAQTGAVIKSTGGAANVTAEQVDKLATAISNKSGIDDEAIASGENMLLTFTNIRNEVGKGNDIFNQSTAIMADMSVALGQDMKSSAMQLGKALNDPVAGITALSRVGVKFTEETKEQIKTLVEAGDVVGAQKIILAELKAEFQGSAAAQATASGKMSVAFGNLQEAIGGVVAGGLTPLLAALQPVLDFLTRFPGLTAAVIAGIVGIYVATKVWAAASQAIVVVQKLIALTNPFLLIAAAVAVLAFLIYKNWAKIKAVILKVWHAISSSAPFKFIAAGVKIYIGIMVAQFRVLWAVAKFVWNIIKTVAIAAWKVISGAVKLQIHVIVAAFNDVKRVLIAGWNAIKGPATAVWNVIKGAAIAAFNAIKAAWNATVGGIGFTIPSWVPGGLGGQSFEIPEMQTGGFVAATGIALVHKGETVIPEGGLRGNVTVNVYGSVMTERDLSISIQRALLREKSRSGAVGLA